MTLRSELVMAALGALVLAACGTDERVRAASDDAGSGGTAGSGGSSGSSGSAGEAGSQDAGPPIRTVEERNPFGNTALEDNLLVDGDFEFTSSGGQFGWRAMAGGAEADLLRETGGLCRSGVTCGVLAPPSTFLAFGAAADGTAMEASFWAKPATPDCGVVSGSVISCSSSFVFNVAPIPPVTDTPDASGWCEYRGVIREMDEQPCFYLGIRSDASAALIDAAALVPASSSRVKPLALVVPGPELKARMERDLAYLHRHRQFGRPPPVAP
jgi:hypothetical protein